MTKSLSVIFFLVLFVPSTVVTSIAGPRYYSPVYKNHHYSRPNAPYRPYYRNHFYHSDQIWTHLGIGLITGAVIGSVLYQQPRQRTIVYNTPSPVTVYYDPVVLSQRYAPPPPRPNLVLRRVITAPGLLNVRSGPDLHAPISSQVEQNTILDVLGAAPEWLYIRTETGQYGWVMTKYTREAEGPVG